MRSQRWASPWEHQMYMPEYRHTDRRQPAFWKERDPCSRCFWLKLPSVRNEPPERKKKLKNLATRYLFDTTTLLVSASCISSKMRKSTAMLVVNGKKDTYHRRHTESPSLMSCTSGERHLADLCVRFKAMFNLRSRSRRRLLDLDRDVKFIVVLE